ncbi:hypothetical protein [Fictibacillus phosphorivorans]|uniref:hypothetical protein n=1 Tax=Fictibacillus phosphorivorans TaxID=1221500 RepID=UPI001292E007|nr:hypothetical protein [Fictibacillus phosphorivorans]MQR94397.1 hypothetical protein [Fictibacillus phosphorivorans]
MNDNQNNLKHWRNFILFSIVVGLIVGCFSVVSDHSPYFGEGSNVSAFKTVTSYLAIMVNSLPMWFIVAMIVGYLYGRNLKEGILFGAIYTTLAITFYFIMGSVFEETAIQSTTKEIITVYVTWYGTSLVGGCIGGAAGFLYKKTPYVLLLLPVGLTLQLLLNGYRSWSNSIGIAQNITFCIMMIFSVWLFLNVKRKNRTSFGVHK